LNENKLLHEQPPPAFLGVGEAGEVEGMPGHGMVAGGNGFSELLFEGMDFFGNPQVGAGDEDGIHGGMIADLEDCAFNGVRGNPAEQCGFDERVEIGIPGYHHRIALTRLTVDHAVGGETEDVVAPAHQQVPDIDDQGSLEGMGRDPFPLMILHFQASDLVLPYKHFQRSRQQLHERVQQVKFQAA